MIQMSKRQNAFCIVLVMITNLALIAGWYMVFYPQNPEKVTIIFSALSGAIMMFLSLWALWVNYHIFNIMTKGGFDV
jgi:hypothetical protein